VQKQEYGLGIPARFYSASNANLRGSDSWKLVLFNCSHIAQVESEDVVFNALIR